MRPAVLAIVEEVAEHYGVFVFEVLSRDRHKTVARARNMAMWTARNRLGMSYTELGREFSRDHTTVVAAVQGIDRERAGAA